MIRKRSALVAVVVAAVLLVLSVFKVYYVRSTEGGSLVWNGDEAYIFLGILQRGYRLSYLGFLFEFVKESFPFGASFPNDKRSSVEVLRITPNAIQSYVADNMNAGGTFDAIGKDVYTRDLSTGVLMKWSGNRFEPASSQDQRAFMEAMSAGNVPPGPAYDNKQGWSKRSVGGDVVEKSPNVFIENDNKVTITVGGVPLTFTMNSGFIDHQAYIDLSRPGESPKRIWSLDERARRVSKGEYERIFTR
jgi:hypothetical protein